MHGYLNILYVTKMLLFLFQDEYSKFNRGMLRNIGFNEAKRDHKFTCFIFNDVDTIPEDDRNLYLCNKHKVRHYVTGLDRERYT